MKVLNFLVNQKAITLSVILSIVTFQFISTFKVSFVDPILNFAMPTERFSFMDITIRDGISSKPVGPIKLSIDFGNIFKETIKYMFSVVLVYLLGHYTGFPTTKGGNTTGSAIM